jgi:hypothetical protein
VSAAGNALDVLQDELRTDVQLLDHELEVLVANDRDDGRLGIGDEDAQFRRDRPVQRGRLAAVDPVLGSVDVKEVAGGDLEQPDWSTYWACGSNVRFISSYTRCGSIGTLSNRCDAA